ncbi:MAG: FAD-dependent monooxygenase [Deltaproteobacteria bacterium]|nr:FAD-dependent monooxygenase [Deltaproteobacteria bacterium]MBK8716986.1 FAD-dependent monooxygenase [Deltaproteobacteria bacterium]
MKPACAHYDVVIIGAGLAGCATARALVRADGAHRRRILLVDRYPGVHPRFSGEWIHPRGAQVLDDLGLHAPLVAAGAIEVDGFAVFEHADASYVDLAYANVTHERPQGLSVHHKVLVRTLRKEIAKDPIEFIEGLTACELRRDGEGRICGVVFEDNGGQTCEVACDLVVAADGKGSSTRKLAGIADARETIGFTAGVEVRGAKLPAPNYAHVMLGAWGPVLAYPILREADGTVVTRLTFDLPRELPVKGEAIKQYLLRAFVPFIPAPLSGQVAQAILARKGPLEMAPTVDLPAPRAVMPGLALVGDAAGCSHPITASGMTMCLRDAETLGEQAKRREHAPLGEAWLDDAALRRYRSEHDRYVPTRQALANAIYEAFRGETAGARAIRLALFDYWHSGETARRRSMALLSCAERRPSVFLSEYLRAAGHALGVSLSPKHASHYPVADRLRQARGAALLARDKLGLVANVVWAQVRPGWYQRGWIREVVRSGP